MVSHEDHGEQAGEHGDVDTGRMLKISWTDRISNRRVLELAGVQRELLDIVKRRQLQFLGHIVRAEEVENLFLTRKF